MSQNAYPTGGAQGPGQNTVQAVVVGSLDNNGNFVPASSSAGLPTTGGGGGGGGAVTVADGADVAEGATTDAVVAAGAAGTVSAKLRRLTTDMGVLAAASPSYATTTLQTTGNTSLATIAAAPVVATAVVKAASTAAVAADPALVVAISPNNAVGLLDAGGTNKATIKAASTAPAVTDTAVVVTPIINGFTQGTTVIAGQTTIAAPMQILALPTSTNDLTGTSMAAASGTSTVTTPNVGQSSVISFNLSAWTAGSSTGLDAKLQYSPDGQTTWIDFWHFERFTATGQSSTPPLHLGGFPRRITWVNNGGAATTATVTVSRTALSVAAQPQFQFFDRTAGLLSGTASATSSVYNVAGSKTLTALVTLGVTTTPAFYQWQVSADGVNFGLIGTATQATASATVAVTATSNARFAQLKVTTAATSQTGTVVAITAN